MQGEDSGIFSKAALALIVAALVGAWSYPVALAVQGYGVDRIAGDFTEAVGLGEDPPIPAGGVDWKIVSGEWIEVKGAWRTRYVITPVSVPDAAVAEDATAALCDILLATRHSKPFEVSKRNLPFRMDLVRGDAPETPEPGAPSAVLPFPVSGESCGTPRTPAEGGYVFPAPLAGWSLMGYLDQEVTRTDIAFSYRHLNGQEGTFYKRSAIVQMPEGAEVTFEAKRNGHLDVGEEVLDAACDIIVQERDWHPYEGTGRYAAGEDIVRKDLGIIVLAPGQQPNEEDLDEDRLRVGTSGCYGA